MMQIESAVIESTILFTPFWVFMFFLAGIGVGVFVAKLLKKWRWNYGTDHAFLLRMFQKGNLVREKVSYYGGGYDFFYTLRFDGVSIENEVLSNIPAIYREYKIKKKAIQEAKADPIHLYNLEEEEKELDQLLK